MTTNSQIAAIHETLGYTISGLDVVDLNALARVRNELITSVELRVKWINTLRSIVSRKCPKNKVGNALVTDVDLLFAEAPELLEALVKTIGKWQK